MNYQRPGDCYFANHVLTATPQRLRLMLIDGALGYARRALRHWETGEIYEGGEAIIGCQRIVTELLRGLQSDVAPAIVENVTAIYNFVFGAIIEAGMKRDAVRLNEAIAVLEIERETWRQLCEKLGASLEAGQPTSSKPMPHFPISLDAPSGGFTVEA